MTLLKKTMLVCCAAAIATTSVSALTLIGEQKGVLLPSSSSTVSLVVLAQHEKKPETKDFFREFMDFLAVTLPQSNGVTGEVATATPTLIIIFDKKNNLRDVIVSSSTKILSGKTGTTTIDVGDEVVVIGKSNKFYRIEAKIIKLLSKREKEKDSPQKTEERDKKRGEKELETKSE